MKRRSIQPEKIERVVVRGANWVGDAVMTVPALRELRRVLPRARITLATRAWAEGIFEGADYIDELLVVEGEARSLRSVWRQAREWRARRFDLAVLFPNAFAHALVAAAARVPARLGYGTDGRRALLTHPLAVPAWRARRHEVYYYLDLVAGLERLLYGSTTIGDGESADGDGREPRPELVVSEERRRAARALLFARGVSAERPVVVLCPGSTNSRAKRWPAESFAALADLLAEEAGAQIVLVGAREESDVSDTVASMMRRPPVVLTGETTLAETAALLSVADLLVTNDTGPAHVAAAVGRPVVVVFGPTDPATTRPLSPLAEVVRQPPDCAPCMLRDCPIDHRCMTAISPRDVYVRAARALEHLRRQEVAR